MVKKGDIDIKKKKKKKALDSEVAMKKKVSSVEKVSPKRKEKGESIFAKLINIVFGFLPSFSSPKKEKSKKKLSPQELYELNKKKALDAKSSEVKAEEKKKAEKDEEEKVDKNEDSLEDLFADFDDDNDDNEKKKDKKSSKKKIEEDDDELEDEEDEEDEGDKKRSSLSDKFKDEMRKPKSLKEIQEEAKKKAEESSGKSFLDSNSPKDKSASAHSSGVKRKSVASALADKVFLIRGKDNGRAAWHYVLIPQENIKKLKMQKAGTNIDVTDFGRIIRSGWGENPSDEIIQEVEAEYGETQ